MACKTQQKICTNATFSIFNRAIFYSGPTIFYNIFPRSSTTARQFARLFLSTTVGEPSRAAVPGAVPEEPAVLAEEGYCLCSFTCEFPRRKRVHEMAQHSPGFPPTGRLFRKFLSRMSGTSNYQLPGESESNSNSLRLSGAPQVDSIPPTGKCKENQNLAPPRASI
jgi:hypothetical protein